MWVWGVGGDVQEPYVGWSEGPKQLNLESLRFHETTVSQIFFHTTSLQLPNKRTFENVVSSGVLH